MDDFNGELNKTRLIYRDIFKKSLEAVNKQINVLKPIADCKNCLLKNKCEVEDIELTANFPSGCAYKKWQNNVYNFLIGDVSKEIHEKLKQIDKKRENFQCAKCTICCALACSEFSYSQLKEKAGKGDVFANQFLSIFIPYEKDRKPEDVFPDYVKLLKQKIPHEENVYFYYCPKLGEDKLCSDYENRPDICRDFPNNPLALLPYSCGFKPWKDEVEILALSMHALIEIVDFYKKKLEDIDFS